MKTESKYLIFLQENALENVFCKMAAILLSLIELTHWGLVTPFGDTDLGQYWLR